MTAHFICCECQQPITTGTPVVIVRDSMSGGRPNDYAHPDGDPCCIPARVPPSALRRRLRRT